MGSSANMLNSAAVFDLQLGVRPCLTVYCLLKPNLSRRELSGLSRDSIQKVNSCGHYYQTSQYPAEDLLLATKRPAKVLIAVVSYSYYPLIASYYPLIVGYYPLIVGNNPLLKSCQKNHQPSDVNFTHARNFPFIFNVKLHSCAKIDVEIFLQDFRKPQYRA